MVSVGTRLERADAIETAKRMHKEVGGEERSWTHSPSSSTTNFDACDQSAPIPLGETVRCSITCMRHRMSATGSEHTRERQCLGEERQWNTSERPCLGEERQWKHKRKAVSWRGKAVEHKRKAERKAVETRTAAIAAMNPRDQQREERKEKRGERRMES